MTFSVINTGNVGGTDNLLRSMWTQLQSPQRYTVQHLKDEKNNLHYVCVGVCVYLPIMET